jgi:hypothetical protein
VYLPRGTNAFGWCGRYANVPSNLLCTIKRHRRSNLTLYTLQNESLNELNKARYRPLLQLLRASCDKTLSRKKRIDHYLTYGTHEVATVNKTCGRKDIADVNLLGRQQCHQDFREPRVQPVLRHLSVPVCMLRAGLETQRIPVSAGCFHKKESV